MGEVIIENIESGSGAQAKIGDTVRIYYKGSLIFGNELVIEHSSGTPLPVKLGGMDVLKCWNMGIIGMTANSKRKLICSSSTAFGTTGIPPCIPPNAAIIFEIQLCSINND